MPQPIKPDNVDEQAAEPTAVDYPIQSELIELPAEVTTAEGIEDTGYIFDQSFPGDTQPMPEPKPPVMRANRVTDVSDYVVFGSAIIGPDTPPFILIPGHRDRLRVTVMAPLESGGTPPSIYLGNGPDIAAGGGWLMQGAELAPPLVLATRDAIWAVSGPGGAADFTRLQWAIELVKEGCGCQ